MEATAVFITAVVGISIYYLCTRPLKQQPFTTRVRRRMLDETDLIEIAVQRAANGKTICAVRRATGPRFVLTANEWTVDETVDALKEQLARIEVYNHAFGHN